MSRRHLCTLLSFVSLCSASSAAAEPIEITFSGTVSFIDDPNGDNPGISNGDPASGTLVYESSVSGSGSVSDPPYGFDFDVGGFTASSTVVAYDITDGDCALGGDCIQLGLVGDNIAFIDTSGTSLSSTDMPSIEVLASFPSISVRFDFGPEVFPGYALVNVSSISGRPLPEPSFRTLGLAAVGTLGGLARRRARPGRLPLDTRRRDVGRRAPGRERASS